MHFYAYDDLVLLLGLRNWSPIHENGDSGYTAMKSHKNIDYFNFKTDIIPIIIRECFIMNTD